MNTRQAALRIYLGTNGTGKSTLMKSMLPVNERNLIVPSNRHDPAWDGIPELKMKPVWMQDETDPDGKKMVKAMVVDGINTFRGNRVVHVDGDPERFAAICHPDLGFLNGGLVLDDFRNYIPSKGNLRTSVWQLFSGRRHRAVDIFMAGHALEDVNGQFQQCNPTLVIGMLSREPNDGVWDKIPDAERLLDLVRRVRERNLAMPENRRHHFEKFQL